MEALLGELNGHLGKRDPNHLAALISSCCVLVVYPTRSLEGKDAVNNFLFNADRYVCFLLSDHDVKTVSSLRSMLPLPIETNIGIVPIILGHYIPYIPPQS